MTNKFNLEVELLDSKYCEGCPHFDGWTCNHRPEINKQLEMVETEKWYEYLRDVNCPLTPVIKEENNDE